MSILFKKSSISIPHKFFLALGVCLSFSIFFCNNVHAQAKKDTSVHIPKHSPRAATIMSAVLPGLGQAYNKKYWKIPILYAGFFGLGYLIKVNNDGYVTYKDAYIKKLDTDLTNDIFDSRGYTLADLKLLKDAYRRNRDLTIICTVMVDVLNILDANVDAHLFYFDMSDNLSMHLQPSYLYLPFANSGCAGLSLCFNFK